MSAVMSDVPRRNRITVDEYHGMDEIGLLAPEARIELIDGMIIDMPPFGVRHISAHMRLGTLYVESQVIGKPGVIDISMLPGITVDLSGLFSIEQA